MKFKVTGKQNGKHRIEQEDGDVHLLDDRKLAEHEKEHARLGTNDAWRGQDKPASEDKPGKGDGKALKDLGEQVAALAKALDGFAGVPKAIADLGERIQKLEDAKPTK